MFRVVAARGLSQPPKVSLDCNICSGRLHSPQDSLDCNIDGFTLSPACSHFLMSGVTPFAWLSEESAGLKGTRELSHLATSLGCHSVSLWSVGNRKPDREASSDWPESMNTRHIALTWLASVRLLPVPGGPCAMKEDGAGISLRS